MVGALLVDLERREGRSGHAREYVRVGLDRAIHGAQRSLSPLPPPQIWLQWYLKTFGWEQHRRDVEVRRNSEKAGEARRTALWV